MSRKTKKQPYRNALLKLKKERDSLCALFKENQRLNANALYNQEEARTLLKSAFTDKEQAKRMYDEARKELKNTNMFHPMLNAEYAINASSTDTALMYRIARPSMNWNDESNSGAVYITCYNQKTNKHERLAFGFSAEYVKNGRYNYDGFIDDMGKEIANQLMMMAFTKFKE